MTRRARILVGLMLAAGLAVLLYREGPAIQATLKRALDWIRAEGWIGAGVFVALYVGSTVLLIPGSVLTLGAGAIYGLGGGFLLVSLSSTLGASVAFLAGRTLARGRIQTWVDGESCFRGVDKGITREGWKIVVLARLSPVFPFNILNYAMGLTGVSFRDYALASCLGMMPGTLLYVYLGSLAGTVAGVGASAGRGPWQWALYGLGLAATLAVSVFVTRVARGALRRKLDTQGSRHESRDLSRPNLGNSPGLGF